MTGTNATYRDRECLSDDEQYRWWFERRWGDGPLLCWVGLNPRSCCAAAGTS